jgi:hypothetical protein
LYERNRAVNILYVGQQNIFYKKFWSRKGLDRFSGVDELGRDFCQQVLHKIPKVPKKSFIFPAEDRAKLWHLFC